jgi:hypothetical protein
MAKLDLCPFWQMRRGRVGNELGVFFDLAISAESWVTQHSSWRMSKSSGVHALRLQANAGPCHIRRVLALDPTPTMAWLVCWYVGTTPNFAGTGHLQNLFLHPSSSNAFITGGRDACLLGGLRVSADFPTHRAVLCSDDHISHRPDQLDPRRGLAD